MKKFFVMLFAPLIAIGKALKDCQTDEYGLSYDTINVCATWAFIVGIGLVIAGFFLSRDFNLVEYAAGVAALLGAITGAQRYKPRAIPPALPAQPVAPNPVPTTTQQQEGAVQ